MYERWDRRSGTMEDMNIGRDRAAVPVAITSVAPSLDDQHDARRRKYLVMMGLRIVCVIVAVLTYHFSIWLALACIVGGAVLPWCAVLIANDRPPRHSSTFVRYRPPTGQKQLTAGAPDVVDPESVREDQPPR